MLLSYLFYISVFSSTTLGLNRVLFWRTWKPNRFTVPKHCIITNDLKHVHPANHCFFFTLIPETTLNCKLYFINTFGIRNYWFCWDCSSIKKQGLSTKTITAGTLQNVCLFIYWCDIIDSASVMCMSTSTVFT